MFTAGRQSRALLRHGGASAVRLLVCGAALYLSAAIASAETLREALAKAYETNPDLKAARAALDAQNELRPQALSNWLPTVTIAGSAQRAVNSNPTNATFPSGFNASTRVDDGIAQLNLSQPITSGGSEFSKLRRAEDLIRQQRAALLQSEETVLVNAATAYAAVLADTEQLGFQTANRDRLRQTAVTIDKLVNAGDRTAADSAYVRARLAQAEASVAATRGQLDQDRAAYRQVVGDEPGSLQRPEPLQILPPGLDDAVGLARDSNPNVVAAIYAEHAAEDGVDIATAALLPTVSATASLTRDVRATQGGFPGVPNLNGSYDSAFVGLQLNMPLYQAGAEYSRIRQSKKTAAQFKFQADSARKAAIASVTQIWAQRAAVIESIRFDVAQVEAASRAVSQYQLEITAGLRTTLELVDSYAQLVGAQVALSQARQGLIVTEFQILATIGGLTARSLVLPVAYYDAEGDYRAVKWKIFGLSVSGID